MIKGAQKRIIVMKTGDSEVFEEVHFVMRRGLRAERHDMLAEANKIIENCDGSRRGGRRSKKKMLGAILGFFAGGILGVAVTILTYALI